MEDEDSQVLYEFEVEAEPDVQDEEAEVLDAQSEIDNAAEVTDVLVLHEDPDATPDDDDEAADAAESPVNTRTDVVGMMVNVGQIDGWKGGDPPTPAFVESVRRRLHTPILVRETGKKKYPYEVVDGRRRLKALREIGAQSVPVVIENDTTVDHDLLALGLNLQRSDNVIHSARIVWAKLDAGMSERDIAADPALGGAKNIKASLAMIRGLRDIRKLLPELITAVEDRKMSPWSARMAARQPEEVQSRLLAILQENGKVTPDDVVNARRHKQIEAAAEEGSFIASTPDSTEGESEGGGNDPWEDADEDRTFNQDGANAYNERPQDSRRGEPRIHLKNAHNSLVIALRELRIVEDHYPDLADSISLTEDLIATITEELG